MVGLAGNPLWHGARANTGNVSPSLACSAGTPVDLAGIARKQRRPLFSTWAQMENKPRVVDKLASLHILKQTTDNQRGRVFCTMAIMAHENP